jgi:hypothetical protein
MVFLFNKVIKLLVLITLGSLIMFCLQLLALIFWDGKFIDDAEALRDYILDK